VSNNSEYGFGGWLLVFSFLLLLNLVRFGFALVYEVQALSELTRVSAGAREPSKLENHLYYALVFEVVVATALLIFGLIVIQALRSTRQVASTLAIIFVVSVAVFQLIDYFWTKSLLTLMPYKVRLNAGSWNMEWWLIVALVQALIWFPYFMRSKRMSYGFNN
jgi:hypothetical protein